MTGQRKRRSRKRRRKFFGALVLLVLIATAVIGFLVKSQIIAGPTALSGKGAVITSQSEEVALSQVNNTHELDLVNANYGVSLEPNNAALVSVYPTLATLSSGIQLLPTTLNATSSLITATENAVGGHIAVSSGFRTAATGRGIQREAG